MRLTIYVNFAGTCAEAFRYYEQHLGGKIAFSMTHGESPQPSQLGRRVLQDDVPRRVDHGDRKVGEPLDHPQHAR